MPEHQNIEYKESWHDEYLKWVCGFANAQGGVIYIGKDDNGDIVGLDEYSDKSTPRVPDESTPDLVTNNPSYFTTGLY